MSRAATGALLGLAFAAAALLLVRFAGAYRRPTLVDRIGPYVGPLRPALAPAPRSASPAVPVVDLGAWLRRRSRDLPQRLARAGQTVDVTSYRLDQLAWAGVGGCLGALLGLVLALRGSAPAGIVVPGALGAAAGAVGRDVALSRQARRRREAIEASLPTLADLVALAVTSGAGPVSALDRAAAAMTGPLADEVRACVDDIRSGTPAEPALHALSARVDVAAVGRLVDALLLSVDRGSPLADVARAHAADVRADERRRLLELAGRKDVLMLVPIVLLVLPSVVIVAAFPGIAALRLVVP